MVDCSSAYNAANVLICGDDIDLMSKVAYECPCFAHLVYMSKDYDSIITLLQALEHTDIDVYKIERGLRFVRNGDSSFDDEETDDANDDTNTHQAPQAFVFDVDAERERMLEVMARRYDDMNARELYKMCADRGITSSCKNKKRETLIQALRDYDRENQPSGGIVLDDDTETVNDKYAGLSARELYEMCKSRDIDAPAKQSAQIYVDLLTSDDALHDNDDTSSDDVNAQQWDI